MQNGLAKTIYRCYPGTCLSRKVFRGYNKQRLTKYLSWRTKYFFPIDAEIITPAQDTRRTHTFVTGSLLLLQ